jgi:hypothetical protein
MISSIACATAITARWCPRRLRTPVFRAQVAGRAGRSERRFDERGAQPRAALVVRPCLRLPALSMLPRHRPAHDARWRLVGKRLVSVPISAMTTSAVRRWMPRVLTSTSIAG